MLDRAPLPVIVHDAAGRVFHVNAATLYFAKALGYELDEQAFKQIPLFAFIGEAERAEVMKDVARILATGRPMYNVPAVITDAKGQGIEVLGCGIRTSWEGTPAVAYSFVVLHVETGDSAPGFPDGRAKALLGLTPREKQIAVLIANGYSTINIRGILSIREQTVRVHLRSILKKTRCHSRTELTRLVLGHQVSAS